MSLCWCENNQLQNHSTAFSLLKTTSLWPQSVQGGWSQWVLSSFHLSHGVHQWPHVEHVDSCVEQHSHMDWATSRLGLRCLLLTLHHINRVHVAQVPVLFGIICELAVETVTFTTSMSVQSPPPLFVIVQLDSTVWMK